jgi:hypothetical protein
MRVSRRDIQSVDKIIRSGLCCFHPNRVVSASAHDVGATLLGVGTGATQIVAFVHHSLLTLVQPASECRLTNAADDAFRCRKHPATFSLTAIAPDMTSYGEFSAISGEQ